jgi:hypothetical protein
MAHRESVRTTRDVVENGQDRIHDRLSHGGPLAPTWGTVVRHPEGLEGIILPTPIAATPALVTPDGEPTALRQSDRAASGRAVEGLHLIYDQHFE